MATTFPGVLVKKGHSNKALVEQIQTALQRKGYGPFKRGVFDDAMVSIVKLFQSQSVDADGIPLVVDGEVGFFTWGALFGEQPISATASASALMLQALAVAGSQIGQMEEPIGSNRGPMVDEYLKAVGVPLNGKNPDSRAWCMAFTYWAFQQAARSLGLTSPIPRTAGCLDHWQQSKNVPGAVRLMAPQVAADPSLVKPGLIFVHDHGSGLGHTGIVERLMPGGHLVTVEGNTNVDGSRAGVGVFRLDRRKLSDKALKGFVDYTQA